MDFLPEYSIEDIIRYGISIIILASMLLTSIYIIWGGLLMVISGGNEAKVKTAVNYMRYAVLGIIVLMVVIFVMPIFLNLLGLSSYGQYFSPSEIIATIKEISLYIFGSSSDTVINGSSGIPSINDPGFTDL